MAAAAAQAAGLTAVHLKIRPAVGALHETRQILKILQKHGEVLSFRSQHLDYSKPKPGHILAVYAHRSSADSLVAQSPLQLSIMRKPDSGEYQPSRRFQAKSQTQTHDEADSSGKPDYPATPAQHEQTDPQETTIPTPTTLHAQISDFNHQQLVANGPYYGPFTPDLRNMQAVDLQASGIPNAGLQDWIGAVAREKRPGSGVNVRIMRKKRDALRELWLDPQQLWRDGLARIGMTESNWEAKQEPKKKAKKSDNSSD